MRLQSFAADLALERRVRAALAAAGRARYAQPWRSRIERAMDAQHTLPRRDRLR